MNLHQKNKKKVEQGVNYIEKSKLALYVYIINQKINFSIKEPPMYVCDTCKSYLVKIKVELPSDSKKSIQINYEFL